MDVASGVALAAGGFTTAFLVHIIGRHYYEPVIRPALLTAMLGYTFVVLGLLVDIGRSWAIWKPMFFWNTHSVLFEVAMCVMIYLTVLAWSVATLFFQITTGHNVFWMAFAVALVALFIPVFNLMSGRWRPFGKNPVRA